MSRSCRRGGDGELAVGGLGHGLLGVFVDVEGDDGGAVLAAEAGDRGLGLAVFEVDGVDDAFAGGELEAGFDDVDLGAVEHEGGVDVAAEAAEDDVHVGDAVAADEVDADVEDVGAFADLLAGHFDHAVDVVGLEEFFELLGAVGVAAFADDEEAGFLAHGDGGVEAADGGFVEGLARFGGGGWRRDGAAAEGLDDGGEVGGGGSAAAADEVDAVDLDEFAEPAAEFGGGEREVGLAVDDLGQAGVGLDADARVLWRARWRTYSLISRGPVAQLRPMTSTSG